MPRRRALLVLLAMLVTGAAALSLPAVHDPLLRGVGNALTTDQPPPVAADIIVVAVDAGGGGLLTAADLVAAGVARQVAVFTPPATRIDEELTLRGAPVEDLEQRYRHQLAALRVEQVLSLPRVAGSEEQAEALRDWSVREGVQSVVLVTSWHHARRVARLLRRSFAAGPPTVSLQVAQHADFEPDDWWRTRHGARTVIVEVQKLLWDVVRHPFS